MTREYILKKMTFQEALVYLKKGMPMFLNMHGLSVQPTSLADEIELDEDANHEAIYQYYMNRKFDPSTFPAELQAGWST